MKGLCNIQEEIKNLSILLHKLSDPSNRLINDVHCLNTSEKHKHEHKTINLANLKTFWEFVLIMDPYFISSVLFHHVLLRVDAVQQMKNNGNASSKHQ